MKVIGISGSPRLGGNTEIAIRKGLEILEQDGIETEFVSLAALPVLPCVACYGCLKQTAPKCVLKDPNFDVILEKIIAADGILVGSPVYFGSATPQIVSLLDRVGFVTRPHHTLRHKVGASIAVARRAGQNFTFSQLNFFFLIAEMIVPGSTYWNIAFGLKQGDISNDTEGLQTVVDLAHNMSWLLKKIT
ncbi:MAG: flavodoxin family protein [Thermoguttaceae bacterium]